MRPLGKPAIMALVIYLIPLPAILMAAGTSWDPSGLVPKAGFVLDTGGDLKFTGYGLDFCLYVGEDQVFTAVYDNLVYTGVPPYYWSDDPNLAYGRNYHGDPDWAGSGLLWGYIYVCWLNVSQGIVDNIYSGSTYARAKWTAPQNPVQALRLRWLFDDDYYVYLDDGYDFYTPIFDPLGIAIYVYKMCAVRIIQNASGAWSAATQPPPVNSDAAVNLAANIQLQFDMANPPTKIWYWGGSQDITVGTGPVLRWPSYYITPTHVWWRVDPTYADMHWGDGTNENFDYTNYVLNTFSSIINTADAFVDHPYGMRRYALRVYMNSDTSDTPDQDDVTGNYHMISNNVLRIIKTRNDGVYVTRPLLRHASKQINNQYVYGSIFDTASSIETVHRYFGVDCADLVGFAMELDGTAVSTDPYVTQIYADAGNGNRNLGYRFPAWPNGCQLLPYSVPEGSGGVMPGDLICIDKNNNNSWDHVVIFIGNGDGLVTSSDNVLHSTGQTGVERTLISPLGGNWVNGYKICVVQYYGD